VLDRWKDRLKEVRLRRSGLPERFDEPLDVADPEQAKPLLERATGELFQMLVRVLPFLIVMWSLAGALYPAVDAAAGEKERGTLETLLVSPATRAEIVWGKFLAVWLASTVTTWWNLLGLTSCFLVVRTLLPLDVLRPAGLAACAVMVLPLSALFAAICLPVGVYARSTKEGQYYLMPLLLGTVLLVFAAMAPDVELTALTGLIPVTGAVLLQQRLMTAGTVEQIPWAQLPPVLLSLAASIGLALGWAMHRFRQEEVLFREGQRGRAGRWLRRRAGARET
jgi:sodium transport system permease protein